jgi:prepilin-type N-terminal cleavage/methylation domain-containing protein
MLYARVSHRRGMTLVELLVVIIILGLLGVAAAPRSIRRVVKVSFGKPLLLYRATSRGPHRRPSAVPLDMEHGSSPKPAAPAPVQPQCFVSVPEQWRHLERIAHSIRVICNNGRRINVAVVPNSDGHHDSSIGYAPSHQRHAVRLHAYQYWHPRLHRIIDRNSWPRRDGTYPATVSVPFTLQVPPMRTTGGKTTLGGNVCVDLPQSTVGVYSYSPTVTPISNNGPMIITFDTVGRPKNILLHWYDWNTNADGFRSADACRVSRWTARPGWV